MFYNKGDFILYTLSRKKEVFMGIVTEDPKYLSDYEPNISGEEYDFVFIDHYEPNGMRRNIGVFRKGIKKSFGQITFKSFKKGHPEYFV